MFLVEGSLPIHWARTRRDGHAISPMLAVGVGGWGAAMACRVSDTVTDYGLPGMPAVQLRAASFHMHPSRSPLPPRSLCDWQPQIGAD
ncbi:hypothetical protein JZ751_000171 [Albula glossodonta]|uniref:Uncharacterized protein n=1 Tax=Albula glossodonta TaxID=121402 RepID=A0A8T2PVG8_9TELE|nr:hypothetical protein JZ751_000171 [Albula glossodonta]